MDPAPLSNQAEGPARLLIVEPNRSALQVLAKRLGELGYRIIACEHAGNAIRIELHEPPRLPRRTTLWARPAYRLVYDPDGRPRRLRGTTEFERRAVIRRVWSGHVVVPA